MYSLLGVYVRHVHASEGQPLNWAGPREWGVQVGICQQSNSSNGHLLSYKDPPRAARFALLAFRTKLIWFILCICVLEDVVHHHTPPSHTANTHIIWMRTYISKKSWARWERYDECNINRQKIIPDGPLICTHPHHTCTQPRQWDLLLRPWALYILCWESSKRVVFLFTLHQMDVYIFKYLSRILLDRAKIEVPFLFHLLITQLDSWFDSGDTRWNWMRKSRAQHRIRSIATIVPKVADVPMGVPDDERRRQRVRRMSQSYYTCCWQHTHHPQQQHNKHFLFWCWPFLIAITI
jgi:hypothetical protein